MQKGRFRQLQSAKKAGNLVADFLLAVPLSGGGYSVVNKSAATCPAGT